MKTKLDYMKLCLHQWEWLEKYPMVTKGDYFEENPSVPNLRNGCAACEWALKGHSDVNCNDCFLNYYAWEPMDYACEKDPSSPYIVWNELAGDTPEEVECRRDAAHSMVEAIKEAIQDEEGIIG